MKKCVLCNSKAEFVVKDSSEYYCMECGDMQFGSIDMLVAMEQKTMR